MPPSSLSPGDLAVFAFIWAAWCGLHSLLLERRLRAFLERLLHMSIPKYRLAYSVFSLISIYPVLKYSSYLGAVFPVWWPGAWMGLQLIIWAAAIGLLMWASWGFSQGGFDLAGMKAAFDKTPETHRLITGGAYAHMRHPMHVAAFLVVWCRALHGWPDVIISLILTVYIALGTWHEEARLRHQFGDQYRAYARRVGLLPSMGYGENISGR
ncbi:MAG: hypothetical protein K9K65_00325 [Desulfarculaceae bacterium]|nr:hypothetical protein [Desulfarculaceae bacterium]MCF8048744.1 hypothetical protein [Desulfarculaceae bacterium]MCF8096258.1 hypothetical protein [Desulfarculaceae bacterium]MCF8123474.1 hypothetical protein [Desulfarculaceae bacterium]